MNELQYQIKEAIARGSGEYDFDLYKELRLMDVVVKPKASTSSKPSKQPEPVRYFLSYQKGYTQFSDSCKTALNERSCFEVLIDQDNKQYAIRKSNIDSDSAPETHTSFFECWKQAAEKAIEAGIASIKVPTEESTIRSRGIANVRKFFGVEDKDLFEGRLFPDEKIIVFDMQ